LTYGELLRNDVIIGKDGSSMIVIKADHTTRKALIYHPESIHTSSDLTCASNIRVLLIKRMKITQHNFLMMSSVVFDNPVDTFFFGLLLRK
jgi:predicted solute-binding protein